jgi:hypothetical protein
MWLPIDDTYSVSVEGQIRKGGVMLRGHNHLSGYRHVKQHGRDKKIHQLVASRFLPAPTEEKCEIDHIDRNPNNNHASNLRWVSRSVNMINRALKLPKITTEKYITLWTIPSSGNIRYVVKFHSHGMGSYQKYHRTLEEAVADRDKYLASLAI